MKTLLAALVVLIVAGGAYYFGIQHAAAPTPTQSDTEVVAEQPKPKTCDGRDPMDPYIISVSPEMVAKGSKVTISGCNLSGFEGDLNATVVRNDGAVLPFHAGTYYRKTPEVAEAITMTFTMDDYCPTGSMIGLYSGLETPCTTVEATPGTYTVYVETPEGKSNSVVFTLQ